MICTCDNPRLSPNPRLEGVCAACQHRFDPAWLSSDKTVKEFFTRLQAGAFPGKAPESFQAFRRQCEARERKGRKSFELEYLSRKNCTEAAEEFADGCNYFFFDYLKHLRETGAADEDIDLVLTGAYHAYLAWEAAHRLAAKRRASP